jgi:hypothetical protein
MPILRIEHPVPDFDAWKEVFDGDPLDRAGSGVRRYRIFRPIDDPNYVLVDLEFDDASEAGSVETALRDLWRGVEAEGLIGSQRAQIVEVVESKEY